MKKTNKKGQVMGTLGQMAIALLTLTIVLAVVFLILDEGREQIYALESSTSYTNQTTSITLDSYVTLAPVCSDEGAMTINQLWNGSVGEVGISLIEMNSGNYTISLNTVNISDDATGVNITAVSTTVNVSFSCVPKTAAHNGTASMTNATATIADWASIIVVAVIGAALIGLVALFRRRSA